MATPPVTIRFLMAFLSVLALACAAALPGAAVPNSHAGHLSYGEVHIDLRPGCQKVPQNKPLPNVPVSNYFTKFEVDKGFTCSLYQEANCAGASFVTGTGPYGSAFYQSKLQSAQC